MKSKFWLRAIPFAVAAQCSLAATNLVPDGNFDLGTAGWTSSSAALSLDARSAFSGSAGLRMQGVAASPSCAAGALYTLNTAQLVPGTMYEFGARTRLEQDATTPAGSAVRLRLGLIKNRNNAAPIYLDGFANTAYAYTDRWARLFGAYKADFLPTDTVQLCVSNDGKTVYIDEVFVRPLTTAEVASPPPATLDQEQLVHVNGNRLVVGSAQTPILLKGINLYGYNNGNDVPGTELAIDSYSWKNYDETSFQEIAALGFNTVRYLMSYVLFEDAANPGIYKEEGWAHIDRAIAMAKKYNLRVILDMHEPPGGIQLPNLIDMNSRPDIQLRLENLWVAIAQRYKTEAAIVAYDLVNEPYMDNWFLYAPTLINQIRAVDPDHAILVETSYHPNDIGRPARFYPLPYANLIYDAHYYDAYSSTPDTVAYSGSAAFFQADLADTFASFYNAATDSFVAPIHVGEYGTVHEKYQTEQNLGAEQWMLDLTAAMDHYGLHRNMFAYHETRFGLYRGWNTYPGESTITNTSLQTLISTLNGSQLPAITFGAAPTIAMNGFGVVSVTALSAEPVTFSSLTPTTCSVTGNTVTGLAVGTCTIAADQPADPTTGAAPHATQSFTISKAAQVITLTTPVSLSVGSTGTATATATSNLPVTLAATPATVCTLTAGTLTAKAAGTCTVTASQTGDASWNAAAQVAKTVTIAALKAQTITATVPTTLVMGATATVTATATSGLPVSFAVTTPLVCSIAGNIVTPIKAGTCTVSSTQPGDATWKAATAVNKNITVSQKAQTITATVTPTALQMGATAAVTATATSGLPVALTVTTPLICSIAGNTVTPIKAGTCSVNAAQTGDATWKAATAVKKNITVSQKTQTITFTAPTTFTRPATGAFTVTATSALPVTVTTTTPTICSVSATTITGVAAGICRLSATQTGDATWKAATAVAKSVTIK